jgi:hypothetical protein
MLWGVLRAFRSARWKRSSMPGSSVMTGASCFLCDRSFAIVHPVESGWTHSIAKHPDYANRLGIVAAEWSGLEFHLCALFGILLGVDSDRAEAVFFTLTNNRARREAIASLVTLLLPDGNE